MKNKGITLIALVVTIVVLLILAGITINLVFGPNGVIKKAQDSKEQTAIGEMRDKLEMAKVPIYADGNGSYKVEDYWSRIESEGLIADKETDIIDNGDGTYEVTTAPGYVFEITIEPNEEIADNIIIGECLGKGENLNIGIKVVNKTTSSIEIELVRAEGASNIKYSIKKQGEDYGAAQESDATTYTFSGLTQGAVYTIKVEATKDGEQKVVEKVVQLGEIPRAIKGEVTWSNGQATVKLSTEENGYQLEWQKNNITEGSWTREASEVKEKTITGLANGDIIYARLYDGVSSGSYTNIEVRDDIKPSATITLSATQIKIGENLTATVTHTDLESGIDITKCKWELNTTSNEIGIEEDKYNNTFSSNGQSITLTPTEIGNSYLHVLTTDKEGNKKETISNVILVKAPDIDKENEGNIDIQFIDTNNNIINNIPTPKLGTGMTAIKWNGSNWVDTNTNDADWYDYQSKKWANAKTEDGSMWVWIPRYAYKIEYLASDGRTITGYSDSRGIVDTEGNVIEGTEKIGAVRVGNNYVVHPAFNYGQEISGIWVAKFEASPEGATTNTSNSQYQGTDKKLQVKPGVSSWRRITISNMYDVCKNYNSALNSHMMKNDEWGAVAYLSKSKYGKENEEVWINNSSSYITGSAGNSANAGKDVGTTNDYTSSQGVKASTTGNVYGVYDMSGGAYEYVAAYVNNGNSSLTNYGASLVNGDAKTKNVYDKASTDNIQNNYNQNKGKYGDVVYETSSSGNGTTSWYNDYSSFPYTSSPFFRRGGGYGGGSDAGVFYFDRNAGDGNSNYSFRPVLVAL